jgi:hypothetical protein
MTWAYTIPGLGQPKLVSGQFTAFTADTAICSSFMSLQLAKSSSAHSITGSALPEIESLLNEPEKKAYPTSNKTIIPITRELLCGNLVFQKFCP